jgi:hypothetical protein
LPPVGEAHSAVLTGLYQVLWWWVLFGFLRLLVLTVVPQCPIVALWSIIEFAAAYVLQDGGIPPNIHVVVDSLLFLGVATAMAILLMDVISGLTDFGSTFDTAGEEISSICLLVVLM